MSRVARTGVVSGAGGFDGRAGFWSAGIRQGLRVRMASSISLSRPEEAGNWSGRLQRTGRHATWTVAGIAVAGAVGWIAGLPLLTYLGADFPPIQPSGILVLGAAAAALHVLDDRKEARARYLAWAGASLITCIALLGLMERFGTLPQDVRPGLDPTVFWINTSDSIGTVATYLLLAAALAMAPARATALRECSRALAIALGSISLVAIVGLTFRIVRLDLAIPSFGMALPVALGLLAASVGLVARRPSARLLQLLAHDSPGAIVVRRLLPVGIVLPLVAGWAQALGQRSGWFDVAAGEGLLTVAVIVGVTGLILWTSGRLDDMNLRRSKAERRAHTHREWLDATLASIGDAVVTTDADCRVSFVNSAAEELLGITAAEADGRLADELVHLLDGRTSEPLDSPLRQSFVHGRAVVPVREPVVRARDGSLRPVEATATPIRDPEDRVVGGVLVLRDAGERRARERAMREAYAQLDRRVADRTEALKQTTAALRESNALLETLVASTPELILAKDREGRITLVNPAALRVLGLSRDQVIGRSEAELLGGSEEGCRRLEVDRQVLESGEPCVVEESRTTANGTRHFLVTKSPLPDEYGQIVGMMSVATDITDRKHAERELEQVLIAEHKLRAEAERANKAKDEFLAVVSHELRSPLNALKGWSQVLSGTARPDPILVTRAAQAIKRNVDHQTRLIDDLLDTSRIISGKLVLERQPVNLVEVVYAAIDVSRASALAKRIELRFSADHPVVTAEGDPGRLQQIVINLLSNAVKFTPEDGRVDVSLARLGDRIELSVSDSGIGIEAEFLPHVFDRFSQADASSTRRHRGLGIGLALVRHLVELHGGSVGARSEGPGRGSIFTVELPATSAGAMTAPVVEPLPPIHAGQHLGGIQVLLVDDDADAREVLQFALSRVGAEVRSFASGAELREALAATPPVPPAVLLLDIAMPDEDGFQALAKVREMNLPFLPAIAVTAQSHLLGKDLLRGGFEEGFGKPVEVERLALAILRLAQAMSHGGQPDAHLATGSEG